jgi:putative multiple sugar transport system permease protein
MKVSAFVKKYTMVIALVIVFIFFTVLTQGKQVLPANVSNLLLQNAYVLVMACGMLLCILTGGNVDLSVGSTLCLAGALAGKMLQDGRPTALAVLLPLVVAALIGVGQGFLIGYIHIPPFICTLAGMFLWRGLGRVVLDSRTLPIQQQGFKNLFTSYIRIPGIDDKGNAPSSLVIFCIIAILFTIAMLMSELKKKKQGIATTRISSTVIRIVIIDIILVAYGQRLSKYQGVPVMLIWICAIVAIFWFLTSSTVFGRYFYAVGGNEKATKLSGIDPRKVYFWAYFLMSILAGLSGLLVGARIGAVDGNMGNSYEMDAIASCFIGGASAYGGSGSIPGVMIGAILLGVINQGMSIMGLPDQWQYVVKGAVLLAAVVFDVVSNHKTGKS